MHLGECPVATDLEILAVLMGGPIRLRMHEVGLRAGATVQVTHHAPFGGRVVGVGASRIALDAATAALVVVGAPAAAG